MVDEQRPASAETVAPGMGLVATAVAGAPLAVVSVSLLNRTVFLEHPLSAEEASAFGAVGAAVLGYVFHVANVIINRAIS